MDEAAKAKQIIASLGGASKVAQLLDLPKAGGAQRVQNWTVRGIPDRMKLKHPELFMPELFGRTQQPAAQPGAAGA